MTTLSSSSKVIAILRGIAENLDDHRLAVRLLATIACVTKEKSEVLRAVFLAKEHGLHADYTAESLAIIVKTLARAHRFDEAREIVLQMKGSNTFWHAEARISIFRFSGQGHDKSEAEEAISHIRAHHLRNDARVDLKVAQEKHRSGKMRSFSPDLTELSSVLQKLEAFEDGALFTNGTNSAYLRLLAQEIIDRIFAETMK